MYPRRGRIDLHGRGERRPFRASRLLVPLDAHTYELVPIASGPLDRAIVLPFGTGTENRSHPTRIEECSQFFVGRARGLVVGVRTKGGGRAPPFVYNDQDLFSRISLSRSMTAFCKSA